jgi:hypothetical protein
MKKFLSILVVLAMVSGVVNAYNVDEPKATTGLAVMKSANGVKVFYKGSKAGTIKVTISNSMGQNIYQETMRNVESFMRPYNLTSISEGEYNIEIVSSEGKQVEKFLYGKNKVEKLMNLVRVKDTQKYVLTVANKNANDKLKISIYDEQYRLLYQGNEEISGDFAKIYNLGNMKNFTFEVTDGSGTTKALSYSN